MTGEDIQQAADLVRIEVQLRHVFSPGSPVRRLEFLAGRTAEIREAIRAVSQQGLHVVIFGERGVGKTSIARFIHEIWSDVAKEVLSLIPPIVSCDSADTYQTIWMKVAEEIAVILEKRQFAPEKVSESGAFESALDALGAGDASPGVVRRALDLRDYRFIVVIDEFDRVADADSITMFADTIKMLSDHLVDATLIIVGVADTVEDLIREHASVERSMVDILVPRMELGELRKIVDKGLESVGLTIEEAAADRITTMSKGLPHYTHLLALYSALAAVRERHQEVTVADFNRGLAEALGTMKESLGKNYHKAISSPHTDARYSEVLLACAITEPDNLGYFAPAHVRGPISTIKGEAQEIPSFMRHLHEFCTEKRGEILEKSGEHTRPRYRFRNPLMQPYILLKGLSDGSLPEELAKRLAP